MKSFDGIHCVEATERESEELPFPVTIRTVRDLAYAYLYLTKEYSDQSQLFHILENLNDPSRMLVDNGYIGPLKYGLDLHPYCNQSISGWLKVLETPDYNHKRVLYPHVYEVDYTNEEKVCRYIGIYTTIFKRDGVTTGMLYDPRLSKSKKDHINRQFRVTAPPFRIVNRNEGFKIRSIDLDDEIVEVPHPIVVIGRRSVYTKGFGAEAIWGINDYGVDSVESYHKILKDNAITNFEP
jgi:hypothetical protein